MVPAAMAGSSISTSSAAMRLSRPNSATNQGTPAAKYWSPNPGYEGSAAQAAPDRTRVGTSEPLDSTVQASSSHAPRVSAVDDRPSPGGSRLFRSSPSGASSRSTRISRATVLSGSRWSTRDAESGLTSSGGGSIVTPVRRQTPSEPGTATRASLPPRQARRACKIPCRRLRMAKTSRKSAARRIIRAISASRP